MKIVSIIGARPQFIKSAPLSIEFKSGSIKEVLIHTGQHFDQNMSQIFFDEMGIPEPNYNLNINSLSHGAMTGKMLESIENILIKEAPDFALVYGDTNSTVAGALAASKLHIPVIHVEAGLRSYNKKMPEEINRILTDHCSSILFCPSKNSVNTLKNEGIENSKQISVLSIGDIMKDSVRMFSSNLKPIDDQNIKILCTIHRQENVQNKKMLSELISAMNQLSKKYQIIFPLHPSTRKWITKFGIKIDFLPTEPIGFIEMLNAINSSSIVLTDSGGLQKEAYYLEKPCITLRTETEWIELLEDGCNTLIGKNINDLTRLVENKLSSSLSFNNNIYGDGFASKKIISAILNYV